MLYLIRLRKILLCNYLYYIFLILIILFSIFRINYTYKSIYSNQTKEVKGIIKDLSIKNDKTNITITSDENVIGTFYYKNKSDKKLLEISLSI